MHCMIAWFTLRQASLFLRHCFKWLHSICLLLNSNFCPWSSSLRILRATASGGAEKKADTKKKGREREKAGDARVIWLIACVPVIWSPHLHRVSNLRVAFANCSAERENKRLLHPSINVIELPVNVIQYNQLINPQVTLSLPLSFFPRCVHLCVLLCLANRDVSCFYTREVRVYKTCSMSVWVRPLCMSLSLRIVESRVAWVREREEEEEQESLVHLMANLCVETGKRANEEERRLRNHLPTHLRWRREECKVHLQKKGSSRRERRRRRRREWNKLRRRERCHQWCSSIWSDTSSLIHFTSSCN